MAGPFEKAISLEEDVLIKLERNLDDVLSNIAFTGRTDLRYIERNVKKFKRDYSRVMDGFSQLPTGLDEHSPLTLGLHCLYTAYFNFIYGGWRNMKPKAREREAEDILGDNHFLSDDLSLVESIEDYAEENPE